jgi:hypothetical protein
VVLLQILYKTFLLLQFLVFLFDVITLLLNLILEIKVVLFVLLNLHL